MRSPAAADATAAALAAPTAAAAAPARRSTDKKGGDDDKSSLPPLPADDAADIPVDRRPDEANPDVAAAAAPGVACDPSMPPLSLPAPARRLRSFSTKTLASALGP